MALSSLTLTPTRTIFTLTAGTQVEFNVTYLSPVEVRLICCFTLSPLCDASFSQETLSSLLCHFLTFRLMYALLMELLIASKSTRTLVEVRDLS